MESTRQQVLPRGRLTRSHAQSPTPGADPVAGSLPLARAPCHPDATHRHRPDHDAAHHAHHQVQAVTSPGNTNHTPSVTVCLVALNEQDHIAASITGAHEAIALGHAEAVFVVDGGSTDDTRTITTSLGAGLIDAATVLSRFGPVAGKGDSMWRAMAVLPGDAFVFLDADISGDIPKAIERLATPLRTDPRCRFTKSHFRRIPVADPTGDPLATVSGGRVTELVARPLIGVVAPQLAHLREPLSGQVGIRRDLGWSIPVVTGYGLEIGMVFDVTQKLGPDAITDVDIGDILNPRKATSDLAAMASDVMGTLLRRVTDPAVVVNHPPERPPLASLDDLPPRVTPPPRPAPETSGTD